VLVHKLLLLLLLLWLLLQLLVSVWLRLLLLLRLLVSARLMLRVLVRCATGRRHVLLLLLLLVVALLWEQGLQAGWATLPLLPAGSMHLVPAGQLCGQGITEQLHMQQCGPT